MPPQQTQDQRGVKRKKPPTFQHLPAERAKKLKRSWVEVQKIKSKWKTQKRREGLAAARTQFEQLVDSPEDKEADSDEENGEACRSSSPESTSKEGEGSDGDEHSEEESTDEAPPAPKAATSSKRPHRLDSKSQKGVPKEKAPEQPTLRDLQKMAYSKASLHHHKSRPLNRHKGPTASRGRGAERGRGSRGAPRGRGRGGGQPDMGLRMKAMLEKIKQDYS
ncbi:hypothetical protein BD413DRAFT_489212 [Trametes elegans]|nr:hypothetical protein BD413DRAFT_489212 [Trametes elegans]